MTAARLQVLLASRVTAITGHIVQRLAAAAVDDVEARYDLGKVLLTLRNESAERSALRVLAESLGFDPSALRRYARVRTTICPDEFTWLSTLRTRRGMPLSWSHIELLAREPNRQRRMELATAVVTEDLSVRALHSRLYVSTVWASTPEDSVSRPRAKRMNVTEPVGSRAAPYLADQDIEKGGSMGLDVDALRESFELVVSRSPALTHRFYEILFKRYPAVKPLFGGNAAAKQEEMLTRALVSVLEHLEDAPWLKETLMALGAKHIDDGVTEDMYGWVAECLLATLAEVAAAEWTPRVESAWKDAYRAISGLMRAGARATPDRWANAAYAEKS